VTTCPVGRTAVFANAPKVLLHATLTGFLFKGAEIALGGGRVVGCQRPCMMPAIQRRGRLTDMP
jgi:hypothetical protein